MKLIQYCISTRKVQDVRTINLPHPATDIAVTQSVLAVVWFLPTYQPYGATIFEHKANEPISTRIAMQLVSSKVRTNSSKRCNSSEVYLDFSHSLVAVSTLSRIISWSSQIITAFGYIRFQALTLTKGQSKRQCQFNLHILYGLRCTMEDHIASLRISRRTPMVTITMHLQCGPDDRYMSVESTLHRSLSLTYPLIRFGRKTLSSKDPELHLGTL